jgi:hypothetical protein
MSVILTVHTEVTMPESKIIEKIEYFANDERLEVHFVGGKVYEYSSVPKSVVQSWTKTDSTGSFFRQYIRDEYDYTEV